jgi:N-acetylneuraminate synthase
VVEDCAEGELLTPSNIRSIRPGFGLEPKFYEDVLGKKARVAIGKGTPLSWDLVT